MTVYHVLKNKEGHTQFCHEQNNCDLEFLLDNGFKFIGKLNLYESVESDSEVKDLMSR